MTITAPYSTVIHRINCCEDAIDRRRRFTYEDNRNGLSGYPEKSLLRNAAVKPPRPRRIILVRHRQREGKVEEGAYAKVAGLRIRLTEKRNREAKQCGRRTVTAPYSTGIHQIKCCEEAVNRRRGVTYEDNHNGLSGFPEKSLLLNAAVKPPRPRRIILVRHGQSEGNVDEGAYTRVADPRIRLTEKGNREAEQCGRRIREMIEKDGAEDWKVYFYVSPYQRTIETLRGLATAFERRRVAGVREEPRLREQDFGNFQDQEQMKIQKAVRARYGRFFYRFPNGESAADVYDRITGFRETLRTDIDIGRFQPPGEQSPNMNLVIVSHGLTLRVFLMRWYKWTVEQFERLNNMQNGNMIVMERGHGGRYSLLVHHTHQEMRDFGLTQEMLTDQQWQKTAKPGELNYDCLTTGPSFFTHFDDDNNGRFS